jgi:uncharacterized protein (TIGR04255 family)
MSFKNVERVIFSKNPLISVTCQLRFPCILSIDKTTISVFQERIRETYPKYEMLPESLHQLSHNFVQKEPPYNLPDSWVNYSFLSDDDSWAVNVTNTYLSLTTTKYRRWEEFETRLHAVLPFFVDTYKPAYFTRIGLRYINTICRVSLGVMNESWSALIQPFALGFLSCADVLSDVEGYVSTVELKMSDTVKARIITALGHVVKDSSSKEPSFIVDNDIFCSQKKQIDDANVTVNELHKYSTNIIRSIITDKLYKALEPKPI